MWFILGVLLTVIVLPFFLNAAIRGSYNLIFIGKKNPFFWRVFMFVMGFGYFFVGSQFDNSFNIIWWSALIGLAANVSPSNSDVLSREEKDRLVDDIYETIGIEDGRKRYRQGLWAYGIGAVLGWILFYGEFVTV